MLDRNASYNGDSEGEIALLNKQFSRECPALSFQKGVDGLTKLCIRNEALGAFEMFLKGAHITSWRPRGKNEVFYLSRKSRFEADSIRGGVPIIFPKFGGRELTQSPPLDSMLAHGFARHLPWTVIEASVRKDNSAKIILELSEEKITTGCWPDQKFALRLHITLLEQALHCELSVLNTGASDLIFRGGFHPYFHIGDISSAEITGFHNLQYEDAFHNFTIKSEHEAILRLGEPMNRVYLGAPHTFHIRDTLENISLKISKKNFPEVVLWSPEPNYCLEKADMEAVDYRTFVCLEPAIAASVVSLTPHTEWSGKMEIEVL